jgi:hypothetical protein
LLHAETVLLVDDHDAERLERHRALDQGVGADEHVDRPVEQCLGQLAAVGRGGAVGEQFDPQRAFTGEPLEQRPLVGVARHLKPVEQRADAGVVLFGQHLGGGHERALVPALHRGQQRRHRHHGLAGTHVALEETVHGVGTGQIGGDLGDHPLLGPGEGEGEPLVEAPDQLTRGVLGDAAGGALQGPLAQHEGQLHPQQLVEHQPLAGRLDLGHGLREVDAGESGGAVDEVVPVEQVVAQRLGQAPAAALAQRGLDP